jgi:hypothetical protein
LDSFNRPLAPTSWTGPHGCHPHQTSPSLLPCLRFERQCHADRLLPPLCPRLAGNGPPPLPATSRPPAPSHSSFFLHVARPSRPCFPLPVPSLLRQGSHYTARFCSPSTMRHQPKVNRAATFSTKRQCRLSTSPVQSTTGSDESGAVATVDHVLL